MLSEISQKSLEKEFAFKERLSNAAKRKPSDVPNLRPTSRAAKVFLGPVAQCVRESSYAQRSQGRLSELPMESGAGAGARLFG